MQIGMIGLGRMGGNMVRRLMKGSHTCVVHTRNAATVAEFVREGAIGAASVEELIGKLPVPRVAWVMVPAGEPTEQMVMKLAGLMQPGDIIIDGGNSNFKDDVRRAQALQPKGLRYLDVGTSGGIWGLERGYCLMIGGDKDAVRHLEPVFRTLAPGGGTIGRTPGRELDSGTAEDGFLHCGPVGAGHFVKMIHNGIEYGMMHALAEGFDILRNAGTEARPPEQRYGLPLADIAELWRRGSVLSSWLLDLTASALIEDPALGRFTGAVEDSGEGRWTVLTAIEEAVPADVISAALYARFRSRKDHTFAEKILSAMRYKFGGHLEPKTGA